MKKINLPKASIATLTTFMLFLNTGICFADVKKEETVYAILNDNGSVNKTIVSSWINSDEKLGKFNDSSDLKNIKNVKGNEKPKINKNSIEWNVNKEDLYYQGESSKKLPIDLDIQYELNGKKVSAKDIDGKSGKFKITIKLNNNEKRVRKINGKNREMYIPFLTATEVLFEREHFKNIKINSGELLDDGKNSSITFASFPGLKETLNLSKDFEDYLDLEDTLIIQGNTNKFKMPNIMVMATPKIPELKNINKNSTLDDLSKSLNDLRQGGDKLLDGSKKLFDGNSELNSKFAQFDQGVKTLDNGSKALNNGINKLNQAAPTLDKGAKTVSNGLSKLNESQGKFSNGVESFVSNTNKLYNAYSSIDCGINKASDGANALSSGLSNGACGVDILISSTNNINQIAGGLNNIAGSLDETNPEIANQLRGLAGSLTQVAEGQRGGLNSLKSGMSSAVNGANSLNSGLEKLKVGSNSFSSNFKALVDAGSNLNSSSKQLSDATNKLDNGGKQLANGTNELSKGTNKLAEGGKSLVNGTKLLNDNSSKILQGTNKLAKGSGDLYKGVNKLKKDGLDKMYKEGNTKLRDIKGLVDIKDALIKLSKDYNNFSGITKDMDGKVKFIMRIKDK